MSSEPVRVAVEAATFAMLLGESEEAVRLLQAPLDAGYSRQVAYHAVSTMVALATAMAKAQDRDPVMYWSEFMRTAS